MEPLKNDNEPAFPCATHAMWANGMTLRDWFAGQALAGMHASCIGGGFSSSNFAQAAYKQADAMLVERAKFK